MKGITCRRKVIACRILIMIICIHMIDEFMYIDVAMLVDVADSAYRFLIKFLCAES